MVTILELYPQHLAINGDMGNVTVLSRRLQLAGHEVVHVQHNPGDALDSEPDIITIGSGPASALLALADDIATIGPWLREMVGLGIPLLAVGGGFHLLGRELVLARGSLTGAGVFGMTTDGTAPRVVTAGYVVDSEFGRLFGIENHGATVTLDADQPTFGTARTGRGNDGHSGEGARRGEAFGTHLHGPVLSLNSTFADHLARTALARHGLEYQLTSEHATIDDLARQARAHLANTIGIEAEEPSK